MIADTPEPPYYAVIFTTCRAMLISMLVMSSSSFAAELADTNGFPPAQCMSQCELAGTCDEQEFEDYPDFPDAVSEVASACHAYLYAVEGVCMDGKKILRTGTGYTSQIRIYSDQGNFEGLMTQTDAVVPPCMGQSFWPRYLQCETPIVVDEICGRGFEVGSPAYTNRWRE